MSTKQLAEIQRMQQSDHKHKCIYCREIFDCWQYQGDPICRIFIAPTRTAVCVDCANYLGRISGK